MEWTRRARWWGRIQPVVSYGMEISLFIEKIPDSMKQDAKSPDETAEYNGIALELTADNYLFLPPDAQPSAEDQELEQAGELYISYGTDKEERKTFQWFPGRRMDCLI